jgi:hypothetical protein
LLGVGFDVNFERRRRALRIRRTGHRRIGGVGVGAWVGRWQGRPKMRARWKQQRFEILQFRFLKRKAWYNRDVKVWDSRLWENIMEGINSVAPR